jgi:hypothetical protein
MHGTNADRQHFSAVQRLPVLPQPHGMPPTHLHATMLSLRCARCVCLSLQCAHPGGAAGVPGALPGGCWLFCMPLPSVPPVCGFCVGGSRPSTVATALLPLLHPLSACHVPAPAHPLPLLATCPPGACCCSSRHFYFWRNSPASCSHHCSSGSACRSARVRAPRLLLPLRCSRMYSDACCHAVAGPCSCC